MSFLRKSRAQKPAVPRKFSADAVLAPTVRRELHIQRAPTSRLCLLGSVPQSSKEGGGRYTFGYRKSAGGPVINALHFRQEMVTIELPGCVLTMERLGF
jgi:hypothetical protein